jgi:hypothetical protein
MMPQNFSADDLAIPPEFYWPDAEKNSYRERLNHWAVVRLATNMQRTVVARFRNRSDADGHLRFLRRNIPEGEFIVVFDPPHRL